MSSTIKCPYCQNQIEITEAINQQAIQQALDDQKKKYLDYLEKQKQQWLLEQTQIQNELEKKFQKQAETKLELKLKLIEEEKEFTTRQNQELKSELLKLTKQVHVIKEQSEIQELELQKQLNQERQKIKEDALNQIQESFNLKLAEKEQQLESAKRANEDLARKLQQGSQQIQGEVLELELESKLRNTFLLDEIKEVPKGVTGADVIQIVKNHLGQTCGTIVWESKNTKIFQPLWINKLKDDQRTLKAEIAILASVSIPDKIESFGQIDGIWIVKHSLAISLAYAIRQQLILINQIKNSHTNKQSKMSILYDYVSSIEFKHRIESIIESFSAIQDEVEKEKRYFNQKWSRQEKSLRQIIDNTHGMYGDMQGIIGKELKEINQLMIED